MNAGKIRVLHISTIDFTIVKMLIDKMNELKKFGYEIDMMSDDTGLVGDIRKAGYHHHLVKIPRKLNPIYDLISIRNIYRILKDNPGYDIVHTHTAKAGFAGRIAARLAGVAIVVHTSHGLPFYKGQSALKKILYKKFEQISSLFSDGYFSQNYEDLKMIEQMVPKRLLTGYEGNGVVLSQIDAHPKLSPETRNKMKADLGIDEHAFVFFMGARFEQVKNHEMLVRALHLAKSECPVKILLAGWGELEEQVKAEAAAKGLSDKVVFLGYRNDVMNLLQLADAVLLTSEKEGIPRIVMEAMAMSKPVLATNVLGTQELVADKETGELVELNDDADLARKIDKWIEPEYKPTLEQYAQNGRERVENHFTEQRVAERIHHFYQQLMDKKGIPRREVSE